MADKSKLKHSELEKFVGETLSKREPCPAMVLAWGWMMKQGEGGLFHSDAFKQRFFVLARVPHATVLIYYGEKTMDEENILGFIDLRKVQQVREASKPIALDAAIAKNAGAAGGEKAAGGGFMSKLFSKGGAGSNPTRSVVELVTPGRIYTLAPASINMPAPMTTSAALAASSSTGSKPLYLFGWPFPVPPMPAPGSEGDDSEASVAASFLDSSGPGGKSVVAEEAFAQWRDVLATAVAAEKATRTYPVNTLVDSTGQLPQRVFLRTTPCELAIVSMEDKDLCFAALPYNDLLKWDCPVESEIHVTARTRARLVAKSDRSGFSSQRPTRPTCHFVFKCTEAKSIASVIDNHLRALAKQLSGLGDGADEAEVAAASGGNFNAVDEPPAAGSGAAGGAGAPGGEEDAGSSKSKLTGKKPSTPKKSADYEDEEEEEASPKKKSSSSSSRSSSKKKSLADEDEEEEEAAPKRKTSAKKKSLADEEEEEEGEAAPKKKSSSKKKSFADEEEEEEEEAAPKKKNKGKKKSLADEDDEDA